jgi:hypothetical protein
MPELVAVDVQRGWMILHDFGLTLRSFLKRPRDLVLIDPALTLFAKLQMSVCNHTGIILLMGALDRRLERLPGMFAELLSDPEILRLGFEEGITDQQHNQLLSTLPLYEELCQQLTTYQIPQTLHHDDFHDGNIFVQGEAAPYRFIFSDWGESCVAHPFFSIMLLLRSVGGRAGFPDEATEAPDRIPSDLIRLRDIYLEPWQRYESPERLVDIFNMAWPVGMVSRALTWRDYVKSLETVDRAELTYIVPAWLQEFLLAMKEK